MPSKGKNRPAAGGAAPSAKSQAPDGPTAFQSFVEQNSVWLVIAIIFIASLRIVATYGVFSHTFDEPVHIACGMEWLDKGMYTLEPQHPPLARVAAAAGPFILGARSQNVANENHFLRAQEGIAILYSGHRYDKLLAASRVGILPFFWIACCVVYFWGSRYFSKLLAVIATLLFSLVPTVLAHAGLSTTDMPLTAFLGASFVAGLIWIERPSTTHSVWFGVCTGLAVLSKLSALVFFPAAAAVSITWYWALGGHLSGFAFPKRAKTFVLAVAVGALTIWAGYRFSFGYVASIGFRVPAPELFAGIDAVRTHEAVGHWSYILGRRSPFGFWYFYPVALAVKTPLAFLALLFLGMGLALRKDEAFQFLWVPLAFSLAVLQVGMFGHINIGIRHILPVYMGFSILAAAAIVKLLHYQCSWKQSVIVASALVMWLAVSSLVSHPDYIAYFNELAGSQPEKLLVDSDLDWGQDIKRVSKRLRELGADGVTFPQFIIADLEKEHGFPKVTLSFDPHQPPQGYFVAGATFWKALRFGFEPDVDSNIWPDQIPPSERIGKGMFLWDFRSGAAPPR